MVGPYRTPKNYAVMHQHSHHSLTIMTQLWHTFRWIPIRMTIVLCVVSNCCR